MSVCVIVNPPEDVSISAKLRLASNRSPPSPFDSLDKVNALDPQDWMYSYRITAGILFISLFIPSQNALIKAEAEQRYKRIEKKEMNVSFLVFGAYHHCEDF